MSLDGRRAAVLSEQGARIFDLDSGVTLCVIDHEGHHVNQAVLVGPKGYHIITIDNRCLRVSHAESGPLPAEADARLTRELTDSERQRHLPRRHD